MDTKKQAEKKAKEEYAKRGHREVSEEYADETF